MRLLSARYDRSIEDSDTIMALVTPKRGRHRTNWMPGVPKASEEEA